MTGKNRVFGVIEADVLVLTAANKSLFKAESVPAFHVSPSDKKVIAEIAKRKKARYETSAPSPCGTPVSD